MCEIIGIKVYHDLCLHKIVVDLETVLSHK